MSTRMPFPGTSPHPRETLVWQPIGQPRGVVLLSHGMAEHIKRYEALGDFLAQKGYLVAGSDHLGHGPNAPLLGWIAKEDGWGQLVSDLKVQMDWLSQQAPGQPRILLGHSMGSFLAREYALRYPDSLDKLVLSGTGWHPRALCLVGLFSAEILCLLGQERKPSKFLDALAFSANNKPFKIPEGSNFAWLSRDYAEVRKYDEDPLCGFPFTAGGFRDLFRGLMALSNVKRLVALPGNLRVLLISGDQDPVGGRGEGVETIASQFRQSGVEAVSMRLFEGARHELLNETNRLEVMDYLINWLNQPL